MKSEESFSEYGEEDESAGEDWLDAREWRERQCFDVQAHQVQVVPHNPLSPIGLAACLQLVAAIPNFAIQEYATGFEAGIFESRPEHLGSNIVDAVPLPDQGFVTIPTGPGLGMNLVPDAQRIRPPLSKSISMRPHIDGFVVDQ